MKLANMDKEAVKVSDTGDFDFEAVDDFAENEDLVDEEFGLSLLAPKLYTTPAATLRGLPNTSLNCNSPKPSTMW